MKTPLRILLPILALLILALTGCNCGEEDTCATTTTSRYSTQTFSLAGGMAVITQITDHELNKIYYYQVSDKEGLVLKNTIDLTKSGDQTIPYESRDQDEANAPE